MEKTVFEKIITGVIPCDKVFENERILAFHDIAPQAPIHIIIIPKKHMKDISEIGKEEYILVGELMAVANLLAKQFEIDDGYRIVTNKGESAGQSVFHMHIHLLGGRTLGPIA